MQNLDSLFNPASIAVVGVSQDVAKLGSVIFNNIIHADYPGKLFPVNPKYPELFGQQCFASISDIPQEVDLAVIVIPAQFVFDAIKDCANKKVKFAIIISAGFKELGSAGAQLESDIADYAVEHDLHILGPNCLGIIVPGNHLNTSFAAQNPWPGNVAFLSQSGAFNTAILDLAEEHQLGFSHFVSVGNKSGIDELDLLEYWLNDDNVNVIGIYLEEFSDGGEFVELIKRYPRKPIILLHPGESKQAQQAISSHTGSLAGSSSTIHTALRQVGVIQVDSIEKMFNALMMFSWSPLPKGDRVAIITNAGGPGIMMTDMVIKSGLQLAELAVETQSKLRAVLPETASVHNPVDLIGDALVDRYQHALEILQDDDDVDAVIVLLTPQLVTQIEETAKLIISLFNSLQKPIVPVFIGGKYVQAGLQRLYDNQVPAFQYDEEGVAALHSLVQYQQSDKQVNEVALELPDPQYREALQSFVGDKIQPLPEHLVQQLAAEVGFELPRQEVVTSVDQAIEFTKLYKFPVVLKATTEDIAHKTDVKALFLNIKDEESLRNDFEQLQNNVRLATGKEECELLIQEQVVGGLELIVGANRDGGSDVYTATGKGFGHLLLFGTGGIYTEVYKDVSTGLVPLSIDQLKDMISQTKVSQIINGARGGDSLAVEKLVATLDGVQKLVQMYPQISSLDINPAILTADRCVVVDLKIFIQD